MSRKDEKRERYIKELEGIAALLTKTLKKKKKLYLYRSNKTTVLQFIVVSQILKLIQSHYHSSEMTLDILSLPVSAQDIFLCSTMSRDLAESLCMIPAITTHLLSLPAHLTSLPTLTRYSFHLPISPTKSTVPRPCRH